MTYVKLCKIDSILDGDLKQFYAGETEILVIKLNNEFFCLAARCTHAGAPLVFSELNNDIITCPWHGSRFKIIDGTVIKGPAEKPLKVYPNMIREGYLFIEL